MKPPLLPPVAADTRVPGFLDTARPDPAARCLSDDCHAGPIPARHCDCAECVAATAAADESQ